MANYAELVKLCAACPIMRKMMRAHNRIIPLSLAKTCWFGNWYASCRDRCGRGVWPTCLVPAYRQLLLLLLLLILLFYFIFLDPRENEGTRKN